MMQTAILRRLYAAAAMALLVVALLVVASATEADDGLLMRTARLRPGLTRAQTLALMDVEPSVDENQSILGKFDVERLHFQAGNVEVVCTLMFNRLVSVAQTIHRESH